MEEMYGGFEVYCQRVLPEESKVKSIVASVKFSTMNTYTTHLRHMARAVNSLSEEQRTTLQVVSIEASLLEGGQDEELALAVAKSVSKEFWSQFLGYRAENGIRNNQAARCALLKAQELLFKAPWANGQEIIKETNGAERRAAWNSDDPTPVGAITQSMLEDLKGTVKHAFRIHIRLVMTAEFYGCFRLGELLKMDCEDIKQDFVLIRDPKTRLAADSGGKPAVKQLGQWEAGKIALSALQAIKQMAGSGPICPLKWWKEGEYLDLFEEAEKALGWEEKLAHRSHGLRHGGVEFSMKELEAKGWSQERISKLLIMCPRTIAHYRKTNEERLAIAEGQRRTKEAELEELEKREGTAKTQKDKRARATQEVAKVSILEFMRQVQEKKVRKEGALERGERRIAEQIKARKEGHWC